MTQVQEHVLAGILVILAYYVAVWWLVGRDPQRGVIFPLCNPPDGFPPAAVCYLWRRSSDPGCAIAALMQIAVKGHLSRMAAVGGQDRRFPYVPGDRGRR